MLARTAALDGRDVDRESGNRWPIVITCEHGGNRIPVLYRDLFHGQQQQLESHRGYDPGMPGHGKSAGSGICSAAGGLHGKPSAR